MSMFPHRKFTPRITRMLRELEGPGMTVLDPHPATRKAASPTGSANKSSPAPLLRRVRQPV